MLFRSAGSKLAHNIKASSPDQFDLGRAPRPPVRLNGAERNLPERMPTPRILKCQITRSSRRRNAERIPCQRRLPSLCKTTREAACPRPGNFSTESGLHRIRTHAHRFCCPSQGSSGSSLEQKQSSYHPSMPYGYLREPYTLYG